MSDRALAVVDPFEVDVPAPGAALTNRIVHPRNMQAEDRQRTAKPLEPHEVKKARRRLLQLEKQLSAAQFETKRGQFADLREQIVRLMIRLRELGEQIQYIESLPADAPEVEAAAALYLERDLLLAEGAALREQGLVLKEALAALMPAAKECRALAVRLDDHALAVERKKLHDLLSKKQASEAYDYADIIIETWAGLGYAHRYVKKNRTYTHKVSFTEVHVTPDEIYYKINASFKAMFGFKRTLPYGVRVGDLIKDETLLELTTACQRQVTATKTQNNGVWMVVHRLGTTDGLLEHVTLEQVLNNYDHEHHRALPVGVGVGVGRQISWVQIAQHPHFLVGGSTGGGKSNIINVIICTLIQKHSPADVQFVLIDLKEGLEFGNYEEVPHLLCPVITEVDEAAQTLLKLEQLRKERAQQLAKYYAKDIDQYNSRVSDESKRMPRIVVIFDEYAAIQVRKDFAGSIQNSVMQLLNKGRAAGVHLILCTQNPSVEIIPGHSKANMAFRISGRMPTKPASMTILGVGDAADLPDIPGRMIAMVGARLWHVQTPHVRPEDEAHAIEVAKSWGASPVTITLPQADGTIGFQESDVLDAAINLNGGSLGVRALYPMLQESGISHRLLGSMIKAIVAQKVVTFGGQTYTVTKRGNTNYLQLVESEVEPAESNVSG